ncbi:cupin [Niallia sp. Man26]|uniref:cupin n=1 Tax=Niallia sp. Man26 TaxID=2912824 RepID=UPI0032C0C89E
MKFYKFDKDNGIKVSKFKSDFIMSRIIQTNQVSNIGCMHLERNGIVGYHQAIVPQLLLILNGEGYVRNEIAIYYKVVSGDAVYWERMSGTKQKAKKD